MSRRLLLLLIALGALAALAAFWFTRPPAVPAVAAVSAPLVRTLQFSARVATASRVEVGSTITGRVRQVMVREGDAVAAGAPLLRLEDAELGAALLQAQAGERQAQARLAGLRSTGRNSAQAALAQADAVVVAAQAELQRAQDLVARGFVSASRLDETRRAVDVAEAQQRAARAQAAAIGERGTDVEQAEAQLAVARSATAAARARLDQALIAAPAPARVLDRLVEPGQIVQPGRALLALALSAPVQLVAQVDERFLDQLAVGQRAAVVADAFPARRFAAKVESIAPLVDAQRGAIEVKFALVPPAPDFLREDMTLSVEVETGRRERALVVPLDAVRRDAAGASTVLTVRDGRVVAQPVTLGLRTLESAEVLKGLADGDVVLLGAPLAPGARARADTAAASSPRRAAGEDAGTAMSNAMSR